jgi:hypothetical protein
MDNRETDCLRLYGEHMRHVADELRALQLLAFDRSQNLDAWLDRALRETVRRLELAARAYANQQGRICKLEDIDLEVQR